jgi:hypothetical protein
MKKVLLIVSHIGSGSDGFCKMLDQNPRVQWFHTGNIYSNPNVAFDLVSNQHKLLNSAAIWMDDILYDTDFCCPALHKECKFIYLIRESSQSLAGLFKIGQRPASAIRYYTYRLRRICQMARQTGGIFLTWEDIASRAGFPLVEEYLNLKEEVAFYPEWLPANLEKVKVDYTFSAEDLASAERSYEHHLFHLRQIPYLLQIKRSPLSTFGTEDEPVGEELLAGKESVPY